jgi:hypothetical protein
MVLPLVDDGSFNSQKLSVERQARSLLNWLSPKFVMSVTGSYIKWPYVRTPDMGRTLPKILTAPPPFISAVKVQRHHLMENLFARDKSGHATMRDILLICFPEQR